MPCPRCCVHAPCPGSAVTLPVPDLLTSCCTIYVSRPFCAAWEKASCDHDLKPSPHPHGCVVILSQRHCMPICMQYVGCVCVGGGEGGVRSMHVGEGEWQTLRTQKVPGADLATAKRATDIEEYSSMCKTARGRFTWGHFQCVTRAFPSAEMSSRIEPRTQSKCAL